MRYAWRKLRSSSSWEEGYELPVHFPQNSPPKPRHRSLASPWTAGRGCAASAAAPETSPRTWRASLARSLWMRAFCDPGNLPCLRCPVTRGKNNRHPFFLAGREAFPNKRQKGHRWATTLTKAMISLRSCERAFIGPHFLRTLFHDASASLLCGMADFPASSGTCRSLTNQTEGIPQTATFLRSLQIL